MNVFQAAIDSLGLNDKYQAARAYYSNSENLEKLLRNIGTCSLMDEGNVLTSSLSDPSSFMAVTDALVDYVNANLDTLKGADDLLKALLETEIVSADSFVPDLDVKPNATPGSVDIMATGVGLVLSLFSSESHLDVSRETLLDDILDEETTCVFRGRVTMYSNGTVHWSPNEESDTSIGHATDLEIPTSDTPIVPEVRAYE